MFMRKSTHDTVVRELNDGHRAEIAELTAKNVALKEGNRIVREERNLAAAERDDARAALTDIAGMETPSSAHIGKKMAARARQALPAKG